MQKMFGDAIRDEVKLRAALEEPDIAPTLLVLVHLTGDMEILDEVAPYIHGAWSYMESVPEDLKRKVRNRLVDVLKDYAETGRSPQKLPPTEQLQRMLSVSVGQHFQLPITSNASSNPSSISVRRDMPRQMTILPGGGS